MSKVKKSRTEIFCEECYNISKYYLTNDVIMHTIDLNDKEIDIQLLQGICPNCNSDIDVPEVWKHNEKKVELAYPTKNRLPKRHKKLEYPYFIKIDTSDIIEKFIFNEIGQEQFCKPTGKLMIRSKDPCDQWIEYQDIYGKFYYSKDD